ncbi:MAG: tRNA-dihydrouridine synthase family protein [Desulfovibrio sp.]|nr:tRNA-dihydrouridine synthase family protein [Desulfovibrio sp.]
MRKRFFLPAAPAGAASPLPFAADAPWLAPLAGYSDLPFRLLCRHYGAAVCVTEMVSAKGLAYKSPGTGELLMSLPEDQPLVVQLFGAEPEVLAEAVRTLRRAGYAWFDCNMGCSVPKVMRQGAGAALLGDPERALACARAMIEAAPGRVGFKLRLGLDRDRLVMPNLALRLEDAGAAWLTLHPRTARQGFGGSADWEAIARLAGRLSIPLLASGDLLSAEDGIRCLAETGATGLMYARGALHDPAVFGAHLALLRGEAPAQPEPASLRAMIRLHVRLAREHGWGDGALWKMRSLVPRYVRFLPGVRVLRQRLCRCTDWQDLETALDEFLDGEGLS